MSEREKQVEAELNRIINMPVLGPYVDGYLSDSEKMPFKVGFNIGSAFADKNPVRTKDRCPCGGIILADTEEWPTPLCYTCYLPSEKVTPAILSEEEKLRINSLRNSKWFTGDDLHTIIEIIDRITGKK